MQILSDFIDEQIELGAVDPHLIADAAVRTFPKVKLANELYERAHTVIGEMARDRLGAHRRQELGRALSRLDRTERLRDAGFFDLAAFVPGDGWKKHGDLTLADVSAIAADYRRRAEENAAWAQRYERVASHMIEAGAEYLRELGNVAIEELTVV